MLLSLKKQALETATPLSLNQTVSDRARIGGQAGVLNNHIINHCALLLPVDEGKYV